MALPKGSRQKQPDSPKAGTLDVVCERLAEVPVAPPLPGRPIPRRVAVVILFRDESGSMAGWRSRSSEFIPAVLAAVRATAEGRQAADRVYVCYAVMSGETRASPFVPLPHLANFMPEYEPDGYTPLGPGLATLSEVLEAFMAELYAAESGASEKEALLVGDLQPHYPPGVADTTEAGVAKLLAAVKTHGFKVTVVAPSEAVANMPLALRLASPDRPVH